jgi:hypothetical protein
MMAHIHLVQRLERQRSAKPAIEIWAGRKRPPELFECFVDATVEHVLG